MALDGNNEIFPIAYAVVSVEDKDNWSFFLWNLYNIVKESSRQDWTIISDRQKVLKFFLDFFMSVFSHIILVLCQYCEISAKYFLGN